MISQRDILRAYGVETTDAERAACVRAMGTAPRVWTAEDREKHICKFFGIDYKAVVRSRATLRARTEGGV